MSTPRKTKVCSRCGKRKPVGAFSQRKAAKDGLQAWDKQCVTEHRRELRAKYAQERRLHNAS